MPDSPSEPISLNREASAADYGGEDRLGDRKLMVALAQLKTTLDADCRASHQGQNV
jgi:hypothetical protein